VVVLVLGGIAYVIFNRHHSTSHDTGQTMVVPCVAPAACVTGSTPVQSAALVGPNQKGTTVALALSGTLTVEVVGQGWQVVESPGLNLDSTGQVNGDTVFRLTAIDPPGGLLQLTGPSLPATFGSVSDGLAQTFTVNVGILQ
jgi:hypothetical protein